MKITIPAFCIVTLIALAPPGAGQKSQARGTGTRTLVEVPSQPASGECTHTACAEGILDQGTDKCIKASSTPTFGLLFPYPGINNTFVGPAFVGGGNDNVASGFAATVVGGRNNNALGDHATITGGLENTASGYYATVGGRENTASGFASTIGGGYGNLASGFMNTIGGGDRNTVSSYNTTVAGGFQNAASLYNAAVGGGFRNTASGYVSTVAGGWSNAATGSFATIGGGFTNAASGRFATVVGGSLNTATGASSFAAGRRAKADHDGAFVWGDSFDADKPSSAADEFNVYASGGVRMFTNSAATTGAALAPGSGTWSTLSDRGSKENVKPVDALAVLEGVVAMPLATWNYKEQDDSVRHMGPMAQDFHAAFGLGVSDKLIDTVDPDGVALAAIQGLNAKFQGQLAERDAEIAELRAELSALRDQVGALVATSR